MPDLIVSDKPLRGEPTLAPWQPEPGIDPLPMLARLMLESASGQGATRVAGSVAMGGKRPSVLLVTVDARRLVAERALVAGRQARLRGWEPCSVSGMPETLWWDILAGNRSAPRPGGPFLVSVLGVIAGSARPTLVDAHDADVGHEL